MSWFAKEREREREREQLAVYCNSYKMSIL